MGRLVRGTAPRQYSVPGIPDRYTLSCAKFHKVTKPTSKAPQTLTLSAFVNGSLSTSANLSDQTESRQKLLEK